MSCTERQGHRSLWLILMLTLVVGVVAFWFIRDREA